MTIAEAIRDKDLSYAPGSLRVRVTSQIEPPVVDEPEAPTDDQPEPENDPVEDPEAEVPAGVEP